MDLEKAIDYFKSYINAIDTYGTIDKNCCNNLYEPAKVVLDLVKELKEENELRKKDYIVLHKMYNNKCVKIMELEENSLTIKQVQENFIPKDKIKEIIKEELPDDEICEACEIYDVNGVVIKQKLIKLLEEDK